jgi:rare lipoprotein A
MLASAWRDLIGTQVAGRYVLRTLVYAGSRLAEYRASAPDDGEVPVSLVLMQPQPDEIEPELSAIARARQLQHPNLLHVLDGGEWLLEGARMLFIVAEAAEGTLAELRAAGSPPEPAALLEDLLAALEWLHAQGWIYRNLDAGTVVRAGGRWKLADLSRLHRIGQFEPSEPAGGAAPPEAASGLFLPAWDVWTLGLLLRDLPPRETGAPPPPLDAIVRGCLEPDHQKRLSLQDVRKLLKPEPAVPPPPQPQPPARSRKRTVIVAVAPILCLLALEFLRRSCTTPPPAAIRPPRPESHPAFTHGRPSPFPGKTPPAAPPKQAPPPAAPAEPAAADQPAGRAEYFSDDLEGRPTASGERFTNQGMTAASRQFPIGTRVRVTNLSNRRSVIVRVNDRGPFRPGFIVSVTRRAAEQLGFAKQGSARVKVEAVE